MNFKLPLTVMFATLSFQTMAEVSLTLPKSAELLVVNGVVTEDQYQLNLEDGSNQLVFKYNTSFRFQGQQKRFTSEAVILTFDSQDSSLVLALPKLRSENDADNFNKKAVLTLTDSSGVAISYKSDLLLKEGIQLGRDYDEEIAVYNSSSSSAALTKLVPPTAAVTLPTIAVVSGDNQASPSEVTVSQSIQADGKEQINVGQMLDFWYSQADEETRKAFKQRIEK